MPETVAVGYASLVRLALIPTIKSVSRIVIISTDSGPLVNAKSKPALKPTNGPLSIGLPIMPSAPGPSKVVSVAVPSSLKVASRSRVTAIILVPQVKVIAEE